MKVQSPCRLRDRRLTVKPRIIRCHAYTGFYVEQMVPSNHPSILAKSKSQIVDTFQEAIELAHEWAGPKEKQ